MRIQKLTFEQYKGYRERTEFEMVPLRRRQLAGAAEHHRLWAVFMWVAWRDRWA